MEQCFLLNSRWYGSGSSYQLSHQLKYSSSYQPVRLEAAGTYGIMVYIVLLDKFSSWNKESAMVIFWQPLLRENSSFFLAVREISLFFGMLF